jgi:thiosulfate reductase cytochrome b subunit
MKNAILPKPAISAFVFGLFAAVSLTGLLMFFHVRLPGARPVHEWIGLLFVAAALVHLTLNLRQFAAYFKLWKAWVGLFAAAALVASFALAGPEGHGGPGGDRPPQRQGQPGDEMHPGIQP